MSTYMLATRPVDADAAGDKGLVAFVSGCVAAPVYFRKRHPALELTCDLLDFGFQVIEQ